MTELLTTEQTARRFHLKTKTWERNRHLIIAKHKLTPVRCGNRINYSATQVNNLVNKLVKTGDNLYDYEPIVTGRKVRHAKNS